MENLTFCYPTHNQKIPVKINVISKEEFTNKNDLFSINYSFEKINFGDIIIASTSKGLCYLAFYKDKEDALAGLKLRYPHAVLKEKKDENQNDILALFNNDGRNLSSVELHLKGTPFQLEVWKNLLEIPFGKVLSYHQLAKQIGHNNAYRAVGTVVGNNPIALLIPCHRIIKSDGALGNYKWGIPLKNSILEWEKAMIKN